MPDLSFFDADAAADADDYHQLRPASAAAGQALRELRARAERRRLTTQSPPPETPAEMQRLVQELQVHQIELEMQYEELLLAQAGAEAGRAQYLDLYEFAPVGYCTLDAAGVLQQLNLRTAQLLGRVRQQLQGRRLAVFVEPGQRGAFLDFLTRLLAAGPEARRTVTLPLVRPDGQPLVLRLEGSCAPAEGFGEALSENFAANAAAASPLAVRLALLDVTQQQQATQALAESEQRLRHALDAAAMGVVSWDFATGQWQGDDRARATLGLPAPATTWPTQSLLARLPPPDQAVLQQLATRPVTAMPALAFDLELRLLHPGGPDRYVSLTGHGLPPTPAYPAGRLLALVRDQTQRRRTEQELSHKNQLLEQQRQFAQSLFDHSVDALIALDADLRITAWNTQAATATGLPPARALGQPLSQLLPEMAADAQLGPLLARALAGHTGQLLRWAGPPFRGFLDLNLRPFSSPTHPHGVLLIARDVTQREQLLTEATQLQLRQQQLVLSAILTTQEQERRRISEALHNGVGQLLYATQLHLTQLPDSEALRAGQQLLKEAVRATRTISFELTPRILEDFGLAVALRELADRVPVSQLGLELRLEGLAAENATIPPLASPVQMAAYRIVQELLNNVMKHAQAQHVTLAVARQPAQLRIRITDDGVGFVPGPAPASGGIGLAGIRNRIELLGGTLAIRSAPNQGTTIEIKLPLTDSKMVK